MNLFLPFNERKATEAAAFLLKRRSGTMSYLKLIKLLYLADREALLRWGRPISTDRYVSMDKGPVLSRVRDLITEESQEPSFWVATISEPHQFKVSLIKEIELEELSDAETELLEEIFNRYGALGRWELVELTHDLPEWVDPQGSAVAISYSDILRNGGKTEAEIAVIEDELRALQRIDDLKP
jgi:uncharacterized phage-associated protein